MKLSALPGLAVLITLIAAGATSAGPLAGRIVVDGLYADWDGLAPAYEVLSEGPGADPPLVTHVWAHSDRDRLYLRMRLSSEVILQRDSGLVLYIDTDGDAATGQQVDGLGVEFSWSFSDHEGRLRVMDLPVRVTQSDVGLRQAPVVSASEFEVSLSRTASVAGEPLLPGSTIGFMLRDESGERTPSSIGRTSYRLAGHAPPLLPQAAIPAKQPDHIRVLSYNVLHDGCFERPLPFRRIMGALDPDIISLQEIYRHSPDETLEWIRRVLPNVDWHTAGFGQGVILSRFPVLDWGPIGTHRRGAWAILDTPDGELAVVNPHPPCCENDAGRQEEFDAMTAWIRDSRASGILEPETPVVVAGDMNLVGDSRQLDTLLHGAIVDTATHGPATPPDGDGTSLADAMPYHLTGTESYTWRSDTSEFAPGKLDYIVYTDSVLGLGGSFVLWTPDLPEAMLRKAGLEADDTALASDHLPVVADIYFRTPVSSR